MAVFSANSLSKCGLLTQPREKCWVTSLDIKTLDRQAPARSTWAASPIEARQVPPLLVQICSAKERTCKLWKWFIPLQCHTDLNSIVLLCTIHSTLACDTEYTMSINTFTLLWASITQLYRTTNLIFWSIFIMCCFVFFLHLTSNNEFLKRQRLSFHLSRLHNLKHGTLLARSSWTSHRTGGKP